MAPAVGTLHLTGLWTQPWEKKRRREFLNIKTNYLQEGCKNCRLGKGHVTATFEEISIRRPRLLWCNCDLSSLLIDNDFDGWSSTNLGQLIKHWNIQQRTCLFNWLCSRIANSLHCISSLFFFNVLQSRHFEYVITPIVSLFHWSSSFTAHRI